MTKSEKTYADIISAKKDYNMLFSDVQHLLDELGFRCKIKGDHYIYRRSDTPIINIQPEHGKAKAYQIRQIRNIFINYGLEVR